MYIVNIYHDEPTLAVQGLARPPIVSPGNHTAILKQVGYKDVRQYAYYKEDTRGLDIEGMLRGLEASEYDWVGHMS